MGLYCTLTPPGGADTNLTPFLLSLEVMMSGGTTNGVADMHFQEMPGRFDPAFDDLSLFFPKGSHCRIWQTETISGVETIVWRFFGGIVADWGETANDEASVFQRRYHVTAQDYNAAALDSVAKDFTSLVVPAGTIASQVSYVLTAYNSSAALVISDSGVDNITGSHIFAALTLQGCTLRQALRILAARVVAYDQTKVPRFTIDVSRATTGSDFLGPILYFYDAKTTSTSTATFTNVPTSGQWSTVGPVDRMVIGRPPFATRAIGRNIGGKTSTQMATSAATYSNPLHPAGYWDTVIDNMATADADLAGDVARLAAQNSTPREEPQWSSYGRARPGAWVTLYNNLLHGGYAVSGGKAVLVTDVTIQWTEKVFDTTIDGQTIGNAVLMHYTGSDRAPELGDDPQNGPDLQQVIAMLPSNPTRNTVQAVTSGDYSLNVASDDGAHLESWYLHGIHHPIGCRMQFTATGTWKYFDAEDDYANMEVGLTNDSGATWAFTQNGVTATAPFPGNKGDVIGVSLVSATTPPTAAAPVTATVKERRRVAP